MYEEVLEEENNLKKKKKILTHNFQIYTEAWSVPYK